MTLPEFPSLDEQEVPASWIAGVVTAVVTNNQDPDGLGRLKVKFPWLGESVESAWARIATPMAGAQRGVYFLPEVDDEVLVVFEHGDMRFPYVLGALWNGKDKPPVSGEQAKGNTVRMIKSRTHVLRLTDEKDKEKIEIEDGKNKLVIDTAAKTITVTADQDIKLSAPQGQITLSAKTIVIEAQSEAQSKVEIKSSGSAKIEVTASLDLKASGPANLKGSVVNIN